MIKSLQSVFFATALLGLSMGIEEVKAQCPAGDVEVVIAVQPDAWPQEISWTLTHDGATLASGAGGTNGVLAETVVCIDGGLVDPCLTFDIDDSYGDGIFSPGGYWIYVDGALVAQGNDYDFGATVNFLCPPGANCQDGLLLTEADYGTVAQATDNIWYRFTPPANGMYLFSSCGSGCDTRLWIYDYCNMGSFDDTNEGSIYYDDFEGGCGQEATLTVLLEGGVDYWIRYANLAGTCGGFDWEFNYVGPPTGCMDPAACNYSPLAEQDSGNCTYPGDPDCTGPDLIVVQSAIENSLYAATLNVGETDCYIDEGCLNGFGQRELIRFTTHIKNIGEVDYYIGQQNASAAQFEWGSCHNHWHYKGYAEYVLFEMDGTSLPIGFKNGFCVMDLECSGGGTAQYGCSNQGISAHCGDIYSSGLSCQWIDVTNVEDGDYQLVVRVNWDESPDALGRYEVSYDNNWAVVCIQLDRSSGTLEVEILEDCAQYVDCAGEPFGLAQADCNGDCNGTALVGDLDYDGSQTYSDAVSYVEHILGNDIQALPCTDIDQDGNITVTEAALMARCQYWNEAHEHPDSSGVHDKCTFPVVEIINPFDSVGFSIGQVNWEQGYFDVYVINPDNRIIGYELVFSGLGIQSAVSLADPIGYPITPSFTPGGNRLIGLSYDNMSFIKNYVWVPLVRIYWSSIGDEICISEVVDVVNDSYHNTVHWIENGCLMANGVSEFTTLYAMLHPNPMTESALLRFSNPAGDVFELELVDAQGRVVQEQSGPVSQFEITREGLAPGTYLYRLMGGNGWATGRLSVQ